MTLRLTILLLTSVALLLVQPSLGAPVLISTNATLAEGDAMLYANSSVSVDGSNVVLTLSASTVNGTLVAYHFRDLAVTNGAKIVCNGQSSFDDIAARGVAIKVTNDLVVAWDAQINADGKGYGSYKGPANGGYTNYSASHGGMAYNNLNPVYGSTINPVTLGSASYAAGGGAIKLDVGGNLVLDGILSVEGAISWKGSGAGGSVWITGGCTLTGAGTIRVLGGRYDNSQPYTVTGGGGRISIDDTVIYDFDGDVVAGYVGYAGEAEAGTVYFPAIARADFHVKNGKTLILGSHGDNTYGNLTVDDGGTIILRGPNHAAWSSNCVLRADNLTVVSGGTITANKCGYSAGRGPAPGSKETRGGTHAGKGDSNTNAIYGSATEPVTHGSGAFLNGGGALKLIVNDTLTVNGVVSADADTSAYWSCGAGGSIWIDTTTLAGTNGTISANGGYSTNRKSGGGGRIAVYFGVNTFTELPAPGLYTNEQVLSSTVTVRGGYNTSADGFEDGSIYIDLIPLGSVLFVR